MSTEQLLSELRTLDIRLSVDGDRLRCGAPKESLTRELEEKIAAHKLELFAPREPSSRTSTISRLSGPGVPLPLSFAHERFWFLQSPNPENIDYSITAYQPLPAPVDATVLQSAFDASQISGCPELR